MRISFVSTTLALSIALLAPSALATGKDEASPTGKGITGGALLGAEAVMLVEAALDVKPAWAYIVGGLAGGVAGGVGGWVVEDSGDARASMFLLAGGMALAIPTTVAVLATTAYEPPPDYVQDKAPADEPVAEPPQPSEAPATGTPPPTSKWRLRRPAEPAALHRPVRPPALLGLESGYLTLSVPAVEVREVYSKRELHMYGVRQEREVRMPVFNIAF
jgi:hypothetical protein